ncbi:MAG: FAD:protein FMN transferase [Candidatus Cloacimonadota bacterium]|nr:MAG: FAD:protein FMN transferase [Candidatus Cloacimonadota bacterium]
MKKILPFITIVILLLIAFFLTKKRAAEPVEETFLCFDTFVRLKFYPEKGMDVERTVEKVRKELERIDSLYGYGKESFSYKLSRNKNGIKITEEEGFILNKSKYVSEITEGAFDITVGLLENIWGFREDEPHLPENEEIAGALSKIGYEEITVNDSFVSLKKEDMIIDLGGISKGYAVDRAVEILKREGVKAGIVDAGGDLKVFGKKPGGGKWLVGIRDPENPGAIIKKLSIEEGAVATSGDYERYFTKDGKRYHHILNPETGYPANDCVSVTIITEDAMVSDALATGIFVLGPEKGMALIEKLKDVEGLIMYKKNDSLEIIKSKGVEFK